MAVHVVRRIAELGPDLILAPEHFDPRRRLVVRAARRLGGSVDVLTETASAAALGARAAVLVLDTTHAYEGLVVLRHGPVPPAEIGSAKRPLLPGDVIVSRLRPYLRQIAFVDPALFTLRKGGNAVVASTEFFVLRARTPGRAGLPPAGLVPLLLSAPIQRALAAGQEGGHHPRFARELLASLPIPERVARDAPATARRIAALAVELRHALGASRALVRKAEASLATSPARVGGRRRGGRRRP